MRHTGRWRAMKYENKNDQTGLFGRVYKLLDTVEIESIKISMKEKNTLF